MFRWRPRRCSLLAWLFASDTRRRRTGAQDEHPLPSPPPTTSSVPCWEIGLHGKVLCGGTVFHRLLSSGDVTPLTASSCIKHVRFALT